MLPVSLANMGIRFQPNTALPRGTDSSDVLSWLNQTQGAVRYSAQQMLRWKYYSYINYPAAGAAANGFFASSQSSVGLQFTNLETPGAFGNYSFLVTGIGFDVQLYIPTVASNQPSSYTTDALAPYADIVHGLTQGGVATLTTAQTTWWQIALPFMTCPPANGQTRTVISQGGFAFTQSGLTPFGVTGGQASLCYANLERRANRRFNFQNPIFFAPNQSFQASLNYPSGLIPVISTSVINNSTAFIRIGCILDGWKFTPVS